MKSPLTTGGAETSCGVKVEHVTGVGDLVPFAFMPVQETSFTISGITSTTVGTTGLVVAAEEELVVVVAAAGSSAVSDVVS